MDKKAKIARRAEQEIRAGQVVNLGIGIPTMILKFLDREKQVQIHSENGILGMHAHCKAEDADRNLIDAGGGYIDLDAGASFFDSVLSFALIRGGRLDIAFLGSLEISAAGDLANWMIPGKYTPGIGGGMELAQKARRLVVTTLHTDRKGRPKLLKTCTLPLTARSCVDRVITDLAVIDVVDGHMRLVEIAAEASLEEIVAKTDAPLEIPEGELPRF
ncbi:MAG: CoA-transferase subunit beta [Deltaproteobacteria bacterium]|nr:CoA-transferase subunit beta [Deltaproteobacteria bacterium]